MDLTEIRLVGVHWVHVRDQWQAHVNTVTNLRFPANELNTFI
jgi:hypothetical protein